MGKKFEISESDKALFSKMRGVYVSVAEKRFFTKMSQKEQYEPAFSNELLIFEKENDDGLYLLRKYFDTYLIGCKSRNGAVTEYECESLCDALSSRLDQCVGYYLPVTLLEWLRMNDYSAVRFDRNYDKD